MKGEIEGSEDLFGILQNASQPYTSRRDGTRGSERESGRSYLIRIASVKSLFTVGKGRQDRSGLKRIEQYHILGR